MVCLKKLEAFKNTLKFILGIGFATLTTIPVLGQFDNFITAKGSKLMDGDKEFKFLSFNVPTLNYVEDNMQFEQTNPYGLPSEFELHDLYETVNILGGNVVRAYTIPVRNTKFPKESTTYVEAPGVFNEEAFKVLDTALALAREYNIRVILPLVNNWEWMGGRPNYTEFRAKPQDAFWTDKQIITDFKKTIKFVLERTNTVTGIKYKDDKTIVAWETGNELENPAKWAIDIVKYIKKLDKNHLVMDGYFAIHGINHDIFVQDYSIENPLIDIISTHHYELSSNEMILNLQKTVEMVGGKKPLLIGEFGFIGTSGMERVIDYLIGEPNISGALLWSLRRHHPEGGFYHHSEPFGHGTYRAYHWPGFDDGEDYDERNLLKMYREKAFLYQGLPVPKIKVPKAPTLLPFANVPKFSWQGSAGASGYDIERSTSLDGPWKIIAHNIDDIDTPGFSLFSDESATPGENYYYRVIALNQAGKSAPSLPLGPIKIDHLTRVDYAQHLMVLDKSKGLEVRTGDYRSYKEAFKRLAGSKGAEGTYTIPGKFLGARIFSYESSKKNSLVIEVSEDGKNYSKIQADVESYTSPEKNYDYLIPRKYNIIPNEGQKNISFIRFKGNNDFDIVRVELDYK